MGNKTYYIPCIEVVRSFFTPTKTLANYIIKPNGLDFLIDEWNITGETMNINLSMEMPKAIVNDNTVAHLIWTRFNEDAYKSWTSVYNNIFSNAVTVSSTLPVSKLAAGVPIEAVPPIRENTKWNYRGVYNGDNVLILELMSATGVTIPFRFINYYHPAIKKKSTLISNDKIRRIHTKSEGELYKLPDNKGQSGSGKKQQYQPVIETSATSLVYTGEIKLTRIENGLNQSEKGLIVIDGSQGKGNSKITNGQIATTQDWSGSGQIDSLEFNGLDVVNGKLCKGLEAFYKAIEYIKATYDGVQISICEVFLPAGKPFSYYSDGDRRNCAIVRISAKNKLPTYLLEIGRADGWSISTLLLYGRNYDHVRMQIDINVMLHGLISNSGHWKIERLVDKCIINRLKHIKSESYIHRAAKIVERLWR